MVITRPGRQKKINRVVGKVKPLLGFHGNVTFLYWQLHQRQQQKGNMLRFCGNTVNANAPHCNVVRIFCILLERNIVMSTDVTETPAIPHF